tara:strand:- start:186 stop:1133 length:948 start_codon:yes stop_codon:yes gene_type:complete
MVDKSNEYGFIPKSPSQTSTANTGVFEANDVVDLLNSDKWSLQAIPFEVLNVAGGGGATGTFSGGSGNLGGGGGAGGYRNSYDTEVSGGSTSTEEKLGFVLGQSYTVTVGAGGTGGGNNNGGGGQFDGYNGNDSVVGDNTASKGGGGYYNATNQPNAATVGSSGGTLKTITSFPTHQPLATPTQGTTGSAGNGSQGGGGGGAGTAGSVGSEGAGLNSSITGSSVLRAKGGDSGTGGTNSGNSASANTGMGGNGSSYNSAGYGSRKGGNGGSGIVIIRYPNTYTITVGGGLTSSTTTDGSDKITSFTAGTDTISFA